MGLFSYSPWHEGPRHQTMWRNSISAACLSWYVTSLDTLGTNVSFKLGAFTAVDFRKAVCHQHCTLLLPKRQCCLLAPSRLVIVHEGDVMFRAQENDTNCIFVKPCRNPTFATYTALRLPFGVAQRGRSLLASNTTCWQQNGGTTERAIRKQHMLKQEE